MNLSQLFLQHYNRAIFTLLSCTFTYYLLCSATLLAAQNKLELKHQPIKSGLLAPPGEKMTLKVELLGERDINKNIRALLVQDGRLMDLPMLGSIDEQDRIIYSLDIKASLVELVYQFVLRNADGSAIISERYNISRECLPDVSLADISSLDTVEQTERAKELVKLAAELEQDVKVYNQILSEVTQLKTNSAPKKSASNDGSPQ